MSLCDGSYISRSSCIYFTLLSSVRYGNTWDKPLLFLADSSAVIYSITTSCVSLPALCSCKPLILAPIMNGVRTESWLKCLSAGSHWDSELKLWIIRSSVGRLLAYLSLSDFPLHCSPFVLQVGEVLLRVAVWTLGRHGEQLVTLVHQLLIQLLLGLEGRTQLLQDTMARWEQTGYTPVRFSFGWQCESLLCL